MTQQYKELSDEKLVEKVINQDQELYSLIIERYENKLQRYISYFIKEPGRQQDILQQTFIKAFTHLKGFNTKKKFSSWIYRIAHNEAINLINKRKKFIDFDFDFLSTLKSDTSLPEKEFDKNETKRNINECLNEIPIKYKEVLTLYYLEDKKYEEISNILRVPVGTVGTRIRRVKGIESPPRKYQRFPQKMK
jgi:RNA polymerase sigma-70 factor, ECF subfamily